MLKGYEAGCTDYITKPFSVMVLCKKVAAVFANMELRTPKHDVFEDEVLKIDFSEQSAVFEGKVIDFTPKECQIIFQVVSSREWRLQEPWLLNLQLCWPMNLQVTLTLKLVRMF